LSRGYACYLLRIGFLAWLIVQPWRWEVTCSSETSVDIQWTTWCYIPKYRKGDIFI
jgi:hypothetical protein